MKVALESHNSNDSHSSSFLINCVSSKIVCELSDSWERAKKITPKWRKSYTSSFESMSKCSILICFHGKIVSAGVFISVFPSTSVTSICFRLIHSQVIDLRDNRWNWIKYQPFISHYYRRWTNRSGSRCLRWTKNMFVPAKRNEQKHAPVSRCIFLALLSPECNCIMEF